MRSYVYALLLLALPEIAFSQIINTPIITSGPFVGSVTTKSAKVWLSYRGDGPYTVSLQDTAEISTVTSSGLHKTGNITRDTALIVDFKGLKAGHTYQVTYSLRNKPLTPKCVFTTQIDVPVRDIEFLFGSCALLNTGITGAVFPGADIRIFTPMIKAKTDFMVWLGDNIYYLGRDYRGYSNMFMRNLKIRRSFKTLDVFLASKPQYAIWDDHDYGWNDSDKNFPLKDTALTIFRGFWPNTYEDNVHETYFTFRYSDAEFFMTDGRWYRDAPGDTAGAFLGSDQLQWLKTKLLKSDATFKFVCVGSQVLNDNQHGESYAHYPKERNNLLDYIVANNIKGVIFLTGDKHYAELAKREWKGCYTFYDFTSSPITSPVIPRKLLRGYFNPHRIEGTVVYQKNFGKISLTGPAGNRVCKLYLYGKAGHLKWDYTIKSEDLGRKGK